MENGKSWLDYYNEDQKKAAETSKRNIEKSGRFSKPIVVSILPASEFYPAEDYHQDYYKKNPTHYQAYHEGSGRAAFIRTHWGDKYGK